MYFFFFSVSDDLKNKSSNIKYKCIHYHACIWALASDTKYKDEFSHFLNFELPTTRKLNKRSINILYALFLLENMVVNMIPNENSLCFYKNNSIVKNVIPRKKTESSHRNKRKLLKVIVLVVCIAVRVCNGIFFRKH